MLQLSSFFIIKKKFTLKSQAFIGFFFMNNMSKGIYIGDLLIVVIKSIRDNYKFIV
jgi:hypothetical protein